MKSVKKLKEKDPELVKHYLSLKKADLQEQICAEVIDLKNMEDRVSVFMDTCTNNMSKTNYTPEAIKSLVSQKQEDDIDSFCAELMEMKTGDLISYIKQRAKKVK